MEYPKSKQEDTIEEIHGEIIIDPYRWLEDFENQETQNWLKLQHEYSNKILTKITNRNKAYNRVLELLSIGEISAPVEAGRKLFFLKRKQESQKILFVKYPDGTEKELVNPNIFTSENPIALDWFHISPSGKYVVYGLSENGDEWSLLHLQEVDTDVILNEKIPRTRFCSLVWNHSETGFYYTRYPQKGEVPEGQENYNKHIYYHEIGTDWVKDKKIFGEGRDPTNHYSVDLSENDQYLLITVLKYTKNDLYLLDITNEKLHEIIVGDESLTYAKILNNNLWLLTNKNHPKYALYQVPLTSSHQKNWVIVIPESEDIIDEVYITNHGLLVKVLRKASNYLKKYTIKGEYLLQIDLPEYCSIEEMTFGVLQAKDIEDVYFKLSSFFYPTNIYKYNIRTNKILLINEIPPPLAPSDYVVKQVWYETKDKTKVSMFIAHHKNIVLNGKNPTLLCGYGGFNIPVLPPYLKYSRFFWLENGGVIALANLRGGSEYGEEWHREGMLDKKQNVFDDFIAAAEWLIANSYTSKENLGIFGRSNGGLLTGAAITQRPDLFNAVYIGVPLLDMIRYHLFSIAKYWIPEYGSSENPEQFKFIYNYSPYHQIKKNTSYPATFLVAAASDTRVDPCHAMKMTAKMQWANTSNEPIILVVEAKVGHGVGKPLEKIAEAETDLFTFIGWKTGLKF